MTEAYERGQQAHQDGCTENPYERGSDEYEDFIAGWQEQWFKAYDEQWRTL